MTFIHVLLSIYLGTISLAVEVVSVTPPRELYWNRTNTELFSSSHNILNVQIKERIQFNCPYYPEGGVDLEHYIIYMVKKEHYDGCYLPDLPSPGVRQVFSCNTPHNHSSYAILIDPYPALPVQFGGYEFKPGQTYYFTSISTGSLSGLHNRQAADSSCRKWNMKAAINVCCNQNETHVCDTSAQTCSTWTEGATPTQNPNWTHHPPPPTTTRRTTIKTTSTTLSRIITSTIKPSKTDPIVKSDDNNSASSYHSSISHLLTIISVMVVLISR